MKRYLTTTATIYLALWFVLMVIGRSSLFRDPGTFWHTLLGNQMLDQRELVRQNTLTFTFLGESWLALQWLGEIVMAWAYRWSGWDGQLLLAASLIAGIYAWVASRFLRLNMNVVLIVLLLLVVIGASSHHFHVRPHLATILFMGVTFSFLVDVENGCIKLTRLTWLIPLFIVWTNVHGGVLAGLATVYMAAFGWSFALFIRWPSPVNSLRDMAQLTMLLVALTGTLFVNPYGLEMVQSWLHIMSMNLPEMIEEHAPLSLRHAETWMVILVAWIYIRAFVGTWPCRPRTVWLIPFVWLLLAWSRVRHAPLFAMVTAVTLADVLPASRVWAWLKSRELVTSSQATETRWSWVNTCVLPAAVILLTMAVQFLGVPIPIVGRNWAQLDPQRWPVGLLDDLKKIEQSKSGDINIINSLGFGGFLEFYTPRLKPFLDDRCELFGERFLNSYVNAETRKPEKINDWAVEHGAWYALVAASTPFDQFLKDAKNWKLIRRDAAGALYERQRPVEPRVSFRPGPASEASPSGEPSVRFPRRL